MNPDSGDKQDPASKAAALWSGREDGMYQPGDERSGLERTTPCRATHAEACEATVAGPHCAPDCATAGHRPIAQPEAVDQARASLRALLDDLIMEYEDAAQAVAEAGAEQELGVSCLAIGALQARLDRCTVAALALQVELASLDALAEKLSPDTYRKAG